MAKLGGAGHNETSCVGHEYMRRFDQNKGIRSEKLFLLAQIRLRVRCNKLQ